jgi:hypothetical protein
VYSRRNTPAHRSIAFTGYAFAAVGLVGLIIDRKLAVLWAVLIAFGLAAPPRAALEWLRARRKRNDTP